MHLLSLNERIQDWGTSILGTT